MKKITLILAITIFSSLFSYGLLGESKSPIVINQPIGLTKLQADLSYQPLGGNGSSNYTWNISCNDFICPDGSTTTTAQIPFAIGWESFDDCSINGADMYITPNNYLYFGNAGNFKIRYDTSDFKLKFGYDVLGDIMTFDRADGKVDILNSLYINNSEACTPKNGKCNSTNAASITNVAFINQTNNFSQNQRIHANLTIGNYSERKGALQIWAGDGDKSAGLLVSEAGYGTWQTSSSIEGVATDPNGGITGWTPLWIGYYSSQYTSIGQGGGGVVLGASGISTTYNKIELVGNTLIVGNLMFSGINKNLTNVGYMNISSLEVKKNFTAGNATIRSNLEVRGNSSFQNTTMQNQIVINSTSIGYLVSLKIITLPSCGAASNGSVGRNNTGLFFCNTTEWNRLDNRDFPNIGNSESVGAGGCTFDFQDGLFTGAGGAGCVFG